MVIHNLNIAGIRTVPAKTDAPLVVDADTILAVPIAFQRFKPVARRHGHFADSHCSVKLQELAPGGPLNVWRKPSGHVPAENLLRLRAGEALNHFDVI